MAEVPVIDIDFLLKNGRKKRYAEKIMLNLNEGKGDSFYYLRNGIATLLLEGNNGRKFTLESLKRGDFFSEKEFSSSIERNVWLYTKVECEIVEISYKKFYEVGRLYPNVLRYLCMKMAYRLRHTTRKLSDLVFLSAAERVSQALWELSKESGAIANRDGIQIKATQKEVASMVGCSREFVGRTLKVLKSKGLLSINGKVMTVMLGSKPFSSAVDKCDEDIFGPF